MKTRSLLPLLASAGLLASCGSGTFGIFAASDSSSSSSNAATVGSELAVSDGSGQRAWRSPAAVSFLLTDQEGDAADCELRVDGQPITLAAGSATLTQVRSGSTHTVLWSFLDDLGNEGYHDGLEVTLKVLGGISPAPLTGVAVGNDPPEILVADPPAGDESTGVVPVVFRVADSAADRVDIVVEYEVAGDGVDDWLTATVTGTPLIDLETSATGIAGWPGAARRRG